MYVCIVDSGAPRGHCELQQRRTGCVIVGLLICLASAAPGSPRVAFWVANHYVLFDLVRRIDDAVAVARTCRGANA